eukprot:1351729-Alexandrium_andersonii.AAC.1
MVTDLQPRQQAAAVILRLGGPAREMCRTVIPRELTHGGVLNGVAYDPASCIVAGLKQRLAQLDDDTYLVAARQLQVFARRRHGSINATPVRFDTVRNRAAAEENYIMSH